MLHERSTLPWAQVFPESIYGRALVAELKTKGFQVEREKPIKIWYATSIVGKHRLDLVVGDAVVVELKANRGIVRVHTEQMNSYLHATNYSFGSHFSTSGCRSWNGK
jgi:GxxExxY protein